MNSFIPHSGQNWPVHWNKSMQVALLRARDVNVEHFRADARPRSEERLDSLCDAQEALLLHSWSCGISGLWGRELRRDQFS